MEGLEDGGTTWDKAVIEIDQTQKLAHLILGTGLGELLDHANFGGEGLYAVLVHVVAQELQGGDTKNTLGNIEWKCERLERPVESCSEEMSWRSLLISDHSWATAELAEGGGSGACSLGGWRAGTSDIVRSLVGRQLGQSEQDS